MALITDFKTEYRRILHERVVDGKRLGRHIYITPEDIAANPVTPVLPANAQVKAQEWNRFIPILNQGSLGSCTAQATIGLFGTAPFYVAGRTLDEAETIAFYEYETTIDGLGAPYPPDDRGSTGAAALQTAIHFGYTTSYYYPLTVEETFLTLSSYGPCILGINWYDSFDSPDSNGVVQLPPTATIRGGHEIECLGIDPQANLLKCANSWSSAWGQGGYFYIPFSVFETLLNQEGTVGTAALPSSPAS